MVFSAIAGPLVAAGASWLSSRGNANKETKMQKTKRKLVDRLISSLGGNGEFGDLFTTDEDAFQKSFVEPAQAQFRNQTAPQIQQQYIASGQQRGTGLDDTLTRAGVDLDSMLNQYRYQFDQDAKNRKFSAINSITGGSDGAPNQPSATQDVMSGLSGYLTSDNFTSMFKPNQASSTAPDNYPKPLNRKGFEPDTWMDYNLGGY
jgi:hypothetical protein